ncbi:MAG TPA: dTDP-4-dehydrorhamnose 3,5-epimerase [Caulobacteraceae bacterium]|jgi:dTDP-4-dehydrorhamnose 3,5-epimerase
MIEPLAIPGLWLLTPKVHRDGRGAFAETFRASTLADAGVDRPFVQENLVRTTGAGVLRGLHFQRQPHAQDKLIQVLSGRIFDVAVDMRPGSPTLGRSVGVTLAAETPQLIFIPRGFAHGYLTLTGDCAVLYKATGYYAPQSEGGLRWNDPALAIAWPDVPVSTNERDAGWPGFEEAISALAFPSPLAGEGVSEADG